MSSEFSRTGVVGERVGGWVGCGVRGGVGWMGWMESGVLGDFEMDCEIFGWELGLWAWWGFLWVDLLWSWGSTRLWSIMCLGG